MDQKTKSMMEKIMDTGRMGYAYFAAEDRAAAMAEYGMECGMG